MNTLSLTIRYRPVRIGWCIRSGDFAALREAMKLSFTMWGGRYNPLIPIDDFDLAGSLVKLFRVDWLWPTSDDEEIKQFIARFPHLPKSFLHKDLFPSFVAGERTPLLADISHPIHRLHEEQSTIKADHDLKVTIHEWSPDDPLADILLASFGAVPSVDVTGADYLGLLRRFLAAETVTVTPGGPMPRRETQEWSVSTFCRVYLKAYYSRRSYFWRQSGFYVGSAIDFDDLVTFWNLRATDAHLMFYDHDYADRLDDKRGQWLDALRSHPQGRSPFDNEISVWSKRGTVPDVSIFGAQGIVRADAASPCVWNGLNVNAPYLYFSEATVLATVEDGWGGLPAASFQLPQKPYSRETREEHIVASVESRFGVSGSERATFHTPYIPELNKYYGLQSYVDWTQIRVEPAGLGVICPGSESVLSLNALDIADLISEIFGVAGISAKPSKPGLVASRLIQQMGGIQGCRPFKIPGVRKLIENIDPDQSFTRSTAIQEIRGLDAATGVLSFEAHEHLIIESGPIGKLRPDTVLEYLLKKRVFLAGLELDCPGCRLRFWQPIDDLRTDTACTYCGHVFNVTPYLRHRGDWRFRRSGLFGRNDKQEGAVPVVLTLQQLQASLHQMLYTTAMTLKPKGATINECETDFVVVIPRRDDERIDVAIGECKNRMHISDDDVRNLAAVAEALPSERFNVYVVFSKLAPFEPEELARIRQFKDNRTSRPILFTPRELDPYYVYERTAKEFKVQPYASRFEDMATVTNRVFFSQSD